MKRRVDVLLEWIGRGFTLWCDSNRFLNRVEAHEAVARMSGEKGVREQFISTDHRYDRAAITDDLRAIAEQEGLSFESD